MKSTAASGVKQPLKWYVHKVSKPGCEIGRRRAFCLMSLRVTARGEPKAFWAGGEAKASPNGAPPPGSDARGRVAGRGPEAEVIYPWPGGRPGNAGWRPEPLKVENFSEERWVGAKD